MTGNAWPGSEFVIGERLFWLGDAYRVIKCGHCRNGTTVEHAYIIVEVEITARSIRHSAISGYEETYGGNHRAGEWTFPCANMRTKDLAPTKQIALSHLKALFGKEKIQKPLVFRLPKKEKSE